MNKRILFIGMLVLAALACKATENAPPLVERVDIHSTIEQGAPDQTREDISPLLSSNPPAEQVETCHVQTRISAGVLNLRSCGGTACSVITYLQEGEPLTVLERGPWLKVKTVSGMAGYVNSIYCRKMENK